MILSVCDSPDVLKVIRIIRMVIMIIQIVVPLILIVTGMITFVKAVTDSKDGLPESLKIFTKKAIIAVVIFLVPVIVNFILSVVAPDMDITVCFQNATSEKIEAKYIEHMEELINEARDEKSRTTFSSAKRYLSNIKDKDLYEQYKQELDEIEEEIKQKEKGSTSGGSHGGGHSTGGGGEPIIDTGTADKCQKHDEYQQCSPEYGIFGSFAYYDTEPGSTTNRQSLVADPVWKQNNIVNISKTCSNGLKIEYSVHKLAKTAFETAAEKLCQIYTDGIDGIKFDKSQYKYAGSLNQRFISNSKSISLHSYGTAVDINQELIINVNGTNYQPFCYHCGSNYQSFVNALGREDDPRNVNYWLWKKVFEPLGFDWGGLWGVSSFDGVHFEIKQ